MKVLFACLHLKETLDLPNIVWLQFRWRMDKLEPFCRIAGHNSEEIRDILAALETEEVDLASDFSALHHCTKDSPLEAFEREAAHHPVFQITRVPEPTR